MSATDPDSPRGSSEIDSAAAELSALLGYLAPGRFSLELLATPPPGISAVLAGLLGGDGGRGRLAARLEETGLADLSGPGELELSAPGQARAREELGEAEAVHWCEIALDWLEGAFPAEPEEPSERQRCGELVEHVGSAAERAAELGRRAPLAVLNRAARYCLDDSAFGRALELSELNLVLAGHGDDPLAAEARALKGTTLGELGQWEEARAELEASIEALGASSEAGGRALRRAQNELADLELGLGETERAIARLEMTIAEQGELAPDEELAWTQRLLGWALREHGEREAALELLEAVLERVEGLRGRNDPSYAKTAAHIAVIETETGQLESAEARLREALAISEATRGPGDLMVAGICSHLADTLLAAGEPVASRSYQERGLEIAETVLPPTHRALWIRHRKMGIALRNMNVTGEARWHTEQALAICEELFGPRHEKFARDLALLAAIDFSRGDLEKARQGYEEAISVGTRSGMGARELARDRQLLGRVLRDQDDLPGARERIAEALHSFKAEEATAERIGSEIDLADLMARSSEEAALAADALGRSADSEALRQEARESFEAVLGEVLEGEELWMAIAVADAARRRSPELALKALARAEELFDEEAAGERLRVASAWHRLGQERSSEEHGEAREAFERALELLAGYDHLRAMVLHEIGNLFYREDDHAAAAERYREAVELRRDLGENSDPRALAGSLISLGRCHEVEEEYGAAMAAYEEQLEVLGAMPRPDKQAEGVAMHDMADVLWAQERPEEAVKLYRQAVAKKRSAGESPVDLAVSLRFLGSCLESLKDYKGALEAHRERLEVLEGLSGEQGREAEACQDTGDALLSLKRVEEAASLYRRAVELRREVDPRGAELAYSLFALGRTLESLEARSEAASAYEERLAILPTLEHSNPQAEGVTMHNLADVLKAQGRLEEAASLYREAAARKRAAGEKAPAGSLARTLVALASAEHARERSGEKARESSRAAVAALRELGEPDLYQLGSALVLAADTATSAGETEEAAAAYEEAAACFTRVPKLEPMELASMQFLAADAYSAAGREEQVEEARVKATEALRAALEDELPNEAALAAPAIGISAVRHGAREEALELAERMRGWIGDSAEERLREGLAELLFVIGRDLEAEGSFEQAEAIFVERLELLGELSKPNRRAEAVTMHNLGDIALERERPGAALEHYRRAIERKRQAGSELAPDQLAISLVAGSRAALDADPEARPVEWASEAITIFREGGEGSADQLAASLCVLAECELRGGEPSVALEAVEEAERLLDNPEIDKPRKRAALRSLAAEALAQSGKEEEAGKARDEAEALREVGEEPPAGG